MQTPQIPRNFQQEDSTQKVREASPTDPDSLHVTKVGMKVWFLKLWRGWTAVTHLVAILHNKKANRSVSHGALWSSVQNHFCTADAA